MESVEQVLGFLKSLPVWYWLGGLAVLTLVVGEAFEAVWTIVAELISALVSLMVLVLIAALWPLTLAFSIAQKNIGHWRGPERGHQTPEWYLTRWMKWPRTFGGVRGQWMVTGQWFPRLTVCPVEIVPRRASAVGGWTIRANLLFVEIGITRVAT